MSLQQLDDVIVLSHGEKEMRHTESLFDYQTQAIVALIGTSLVLLVAEWVSPEFFNFPYMEMTSVAKILNFWPLMLYASVMASLSGLSVVASRYDEELLAKGMITSLLAGLWEEFGFRCVFVCTSMIAIWFSNELIAMLMTLPVLLVICGIGGFLIYMSTTEGPVAGRFVCLCVGLIIGVLGLYAGHWTFMHSNPMHWFYDYLIIPVVNFVTIGFFSDIFYGDHPRMIVYGMVAANAAFRDGHKYQGPIGYVNSWVVGFVMIYATLHHGIWTAIAIHVIYDLEFDIVRYIARKCSSDRE